MLIVKSCIELQKIIGIWKKSDFQISLVPTMGNLHEGHFALIKCASNFSNKIVTSIFVNPIQFQSKTEYLSYPRTIESDIEKLKRRKVDIIFIPTIKEIYPNGINTTYVDMNLYSELSEGSVRIGHFRGVLTIISKLFNLVQPDFSFFGEKDFHQLFMVKRLVRDMKYNIKIIGVPIVRYENGLAFSSRNLLLENKYRLIASNIFHAIKKLSEKISCEKNLENYSRLLTDTKIRLEKVGIIPDLLEIRDPETLLPLNGGSKKAIVFIGAQLGQVRLIDNIQTEINLNL